MTCRVTHSKPGEGVRFLIAIALLFSVTPGMSEVAEAAVHLIAHGDMSHHDDAEQGCPEHSCTPLAHHCACHTTMSAQVATWVGSPTYVGVTSLQPLRATSGAGQPYEWSVLRPPIR